MSVQKVVPMHPTTVDYKGHTIKLTHRPRTNDWQYEVKHHRTITLKNQAPRYEAALKQAQTDIDILMGDK